MGSGAHITHRNLGSQVKVAVNQQHGVAMILQGERKEVVAVVLEKLLQQELCRGCKERVLAVWGADVLGWHDGDRVVRRLGRDVEGTVPAHCNLLLHHTEAVEPAEQETSAVHPQVEVHIVTQEPARNQRRGRWHWTQLVPPPAPHTWSVRPSTGGYRGEGGSLLPSRPSSRKAQKAKQTRRRGQAVMCRHQGWQGIPKA